MSDMDGKVYLKDTITGETVNITQDCLDSSEYYWTEGNMACDCNRATYFKVPEDERKCGNTRYELIIGENFCWLHYYDDVSPEQYGT
jgi:hypothetical protein